MGKKITVLGASSAGLLVARALVERGYPPEDIIIVGNRNYGSSGLSTWYIRQQEPRALATLILSRMGGGYRADGAALAEKIALDNIPATEAFKSLLQEIDPQGVHIYENGFSGIPALPGFAPQTPLAGKIIIDHLRKTLQEKGCVFHYGTIADLAKSDKGFAVTLNSRTNGHSAVHSDALIIATGGLAHTRQRSTSNHQDIPNVVELARDRLGVKVTDLEKSVFFPFCVEEKGYRHGGLLPPSFMTKAQIMRRKDGKVEPFLPEELTRTIRSGDYRPIFLKLTALFQEQQRQGYEVVAVTTMSAEEFADYQRHDHYGYVFHGKKYEEVARGVVISPAYHTSLGGVAINSAMETNIQGVFACGEAVGVYGHDRILGGEHLGAIALAPLLAENVRKRCYGIAPSHLTPGHSGLLNLQDMRRIVDGFDDKIALALKTAFKRKQETIPQDMAEFWKQLETLVAPERVPLSAICGEAMQDPALNQSLANASADALKDLVALVAARVSFIRDYVSPLKQGPGQIRNAAREAEVVGRVLQHFPPEESDTVASAQYFYESVVLPLSFAVQRQQMATRQAAKY